MDERLKQRLVGAAVLVSIAVIVAPMVFDTASGPDESISESNVPPRPEGAFRSRIIPVQETELRDLQRSSTSAVVPVRMSSGPGPAPASEPATVTDRVSTNLNMARTTPAKQVAGALTAWVVQLGSFAESGNALGLRDRLRSKGYAAFVETVKLDGSKSTRVYVGPELLKARALVVRKRLEHELGMKGLIVRYPAS